MTGGREVWSLTVSRYNTAMAAIRQVAGLGLRYKFCIVTRRRPTVLPIQHATQGHYTAGRRATTWPGHGHDTAQASGLSALRATWAHHGSCFGLNALFQSLFGPLFMNIVHEHCSQDFSKKKKKLNKYINK